MTDQFTGIRLKLARARDQLQVLRAEFRAFLEKHPYRSKGDFNQDTRILTFSVEIVGDPPNPMWGVRIGEVVHNLRSALDHSIWELVILTTGRPPTLPSKNQFPIFKTEKGEQAFEGRGVKVHLQCVRQDAVDLIKSEQPFSTGEHIQSPLWHLQELSNADKHRTLHLTGATVSKFSFQMPPLLEPLNVQVLESASIGPIQQNAVLWRGRLGGKLPWPFETRDIKGQLATNIAFDHATPAVGGWIADATLTLIEQRTSRVLARIAQEIFKTTL